MILLSWHPICIIVPGMKSGREAARRWEEKEWVVSVSFCKMKRFVQVGVMMAAQQIEYTAYQ